MSENARDAAIGIAITVAVLAGIIFLILTLTGVGERNREKVVEMHTTCVEAGYSGWDDYYGCIGGPGNG